MRGEKVFCPPVEVALAAAKIDQTEGTLHWRQPLGLNRPEHLFILRLQALLVFYNFRIYCIPNR